MTDDLDPALRELVLLVNRHGSPTAFRALVRLLNNQRPALDVTDEQLEREPAVEDPHERVKRQFADYGRPYTGYTGPLPITTRAEPARRTWLARLLRRQGDPA